MREFAFILTCLQLDIVNPVQSHSFTMKSNVLDARAKGLIYFKNFYLPVIGDSN